MFILHIFLNAYTRNPKVCLLLTLALETPNLNIAPGSTRQQCWRTGLQKSEMKEEMSEYEAQILTFVFHHFGTELDRARGLCEDGIQGWIRDVYDRRADHI